MGTPSVVQMTPKTEAPPALFDPATVQDALDQHHDKQSRQFDVKGFTAFLNDWAYQRSRERHPEGFAPLGSQTAAEGLALSLSSHLDESIQAVPGEDAILVPLGLPFTASLRIEVGNFSLFVDDEQVIRAAAKLTPETVTAVCDDGLRFHHNDLYAPIQKHEDRVGAALALMRACRDLLVLATFGDEVRS